MIKFVIVCLCIFLCLYGHLHAAVDKEGIIEELEKQFSQLNSLHIKLKKQASSLVQPQKVFDFIKVPSSRVDLFCQKPTIHEYRFQDGNIRTMDEIPYLEDKRIVFLTRETTANNEIFCFFDRDDMTSKTYLSLTKDFSGPSNTHRLFYFKMEYFPVAGLEMPESNVSWPSPKITSSVAQLLKNSGTVVSLDELDIEGRKSIVLVINSINPNKILAQKKSIENVKEELKDSIDSPEQKERIIQQILDTQNLPDVVENEIVLDPSLGYTIVSWEKRYSKDKIISKSTCSDHFQLHGTGIWLPRRVTEDYHTFFTIPNKHFVKPLFTVEYDVTDCDVERVDKSFFIIQASVSGTRVFDYTLPEAKNTSEGYITYIVPADPNDLDRVIELAKGHIVSQTGFIFIRLVFVFLGLVLIILGIYFTFFKKK
jgi:hypothetical protein